MRFLTNEGEFGILLAKASNGAEADPAMAVFRFQLLLDGELVGEAKPCNPGPAFGNLRKPCRLDADRARGLPGGPEALHAYLHADALLHAGTKGPRAASMDGWACHLFVAGSRVALLARDRRGPERDAAGAVRSCSVGIEDYFDVVGCAFEYWNLVRMNVPRFF